MKRIARAKVSMQSLRLLTLFALSTTAQAELVEIAWDADGRFGRQLTVAPGKFAELCGKLTAKSLVQWKFDSEAATDFNIHFHAGKAVRYPVKKDAVSGADGTLDVSREEAYCWMWSNRSTSSVVVQVQLKRVAAR